MDEGGNVLSLVPKGVYRSTISIGDHWIEKPMLPIGAVKSLVELTGDYVFFTPAILYMYGQMTDEPLGDFMHLHGGVPFYHRRFDRPLFRGLDVAGNPDWNHVLWAVDKAHWEAFHNFYLSICLIEPVLGLTMQIGSLTVEVADPLAILSQATVPIVAFGIEGNLCQLALLGSPPALTRVEPTEKMVRLAAALLNRRSKP